MKMICLPAIAIFWRYIPVPYCMIDVSVSFCLYDLTGGCNVQCSVYTEPFIPPFDIDFDIYGGQRSVSWVSYHLTSVIHEGIRCHDHYLMALPSSIYGGKPVVVIKSRVCTGLYLYSLSVLWHHHHSSNKIGGAFAQLQSYDHWYDDYYSWSYFDNSRHWWIIPSKCYRRRTS